MPPMLLSDWPIPDVTSTALEQHFARLDPLSVRVAATLAVEFVAADTGLRDERVLAACLASRRAARGLPPKPLPPWGDWRPSHATWHLLSAAKSLVADLDDPGIYPLRAADLIHTAILAWAALTAPRRPHEVFFDVSGLPTRSDDAEVRLAPDGALLIAVRSGIATAGTGRERLLRLLAGTRLTLAGQHALRIDAGGFLITDHVVETVVGDRRIKQAAGNLWTGSAGDILDATAGGRDVRLPAFTLFGHPLGTLSTRFLARWWALVAVALGLAESE